MNRIYMITALLLLVVAPRPLDAGETGTMAAGAYLGQGFSFAAGPGPESTFGSDRDDRSAKFSGAFGFYFRYGLIDMLSLETGVGFHSHGVRWKIRDDSFKIRHFYMEIPVMARFHIHNFRAGAGLALWFALAGKSTAKVGSTKTTDTWRGSDWDYFHRVNLGPKFDVGYAIPIGPIFLVPSLSWSIHLINDIDRNAIEDDFRFIDTDDYRSRYNHLMLNVAAEWVF